MSDLIEFKAWPKTPRFFRDVVITEKIDGTNAAVIVTDDGQVGAQSRNRVITPEADNFGFARWVAEHAERLADLLGPGHHFGEWYGSGVQRGYGLTGGEKRFALFNVHRYAEAASASEGLFEVVPTIYVGPYSEEAVRNALVALRNGGSWAVPGFANPEGVIVWHSASRQVYKALLDSDHLPKGLIA